MNPTGTFDYARLKALFARLVRAVGTQDAAAEYLGISRQRVSQICSANPEHARDLPTWEQVWVLEDAIDVSVVFAGLAASIGPEPVKRACPVSETFDVIRVSATLGPLAMDVKNGVPGAQERFCQAIDALKLEVCESEAAAMGAAVHQLKGA